MPTIRMRAAFAVSGFLLLTSGAAHAQLFRAYLASYGNDANPCTVGQPCRLLPAGINAVAEYGEVWILDSANYNQGTVTINKSVSILAIPGQVGSIVAVNNAPAIAITSGQVVLRNMVIGNNGVHPGTDGIDNSGGDLSIENSVITDVPGKALYAHGTSSSRTRLTNSVIRNVGYGIYADETASVHGDHLQILNVSYAGFVHNNSDTATDLHLSDSAVRTATYGFGAGSESSDFNGRARVYLTRVSLSAVEFENVSASTSSLGGYAQVFINGSSLAGRKAYSASGTNASIVSTGSNFIEGTGSGTFTTVPLQ